MVGTKSTSSADPTYMRKIRKPLVEKRRRDRMNNSLAQLKSLLAVNIKQNSSTSMARLDKADILELTVNQLTSLTHQQRSASLATDVDSYKKGFKDCARETISYLTKTQALDTDSLFRLNNHLQSTYLEKTERIPNMSYSAEVPSAHDSSSQTDIDYGSISLHVTNQSTFYGSIVQSGISDYKGRYFNEQYHPCNDSVDTSLNSSANMSLDSSSSLTPEKVVPYQKTDEEVWRPW